MTDTIWGIPCRWYRILFYLSIPVTVILMLIAVPKSDLPQLISDKQAHFIIFFGITLLCSRGMRNNYGVSALLWLAGFGLLLEFMQWLVPWRSFSWLDWLADIAGILSYHILYMSNAFLQQKRS